MLRVRCIAHPCGEISTLGEGKFLSEDARRCKSSDAMSERGKYQRGRSLGVTSDYRGTLIGADTKLLHQWDSREEFRSECVRKALTSTLTKGGKSTPIGGL